MAADLLTRKATSFVLWRPGNANPKPKLIIGQLQLTNPVSLANERTFTLRKVVGFEDLWEIPAADCALVDGQVYHYWFEVTDSHPGRPANTRIRITDPTAFMVDWRLYADKPADSAYTGDDQYPAAVIKFAGDQLIACDSGGEVADLTNEPLLATLPRNNRLVIYELPTAWTRIGSSGEKEVGVGTFKDTAALIDPHEEGADFSDLEVLRGSYLPDMGINALELLPPADSFYSRTWGYGTTNFFAPDYELGFPSENASAVPNRDLATLIRACHAHGMRFFVDTVMAFARTNPYLAGNTNEFFILNPGTSAGDPDALSSRGATRDGSGSTLFRYAAFVNAYDPISGKKQDISPARQLMKLALTRWMNDFHVDGLRLDTVENVANWDFVEEYRNLAHDLYRQRFAAQGVAGNAEERFLVVGEELNEPLELLRQQLPDGTHNRLDGLWHNAFKGLIRRAITGRKADSDPDLATTVMRAIDCRSFGYTDGAQAIIYLTSHDVEGQENERLFNYLLNNQVVDSEKRMKLAFACLLTAVGIPMILAGDEFADQHDLLDARGNVTEQGGKQIDPVNFSRASEEWRRRVRDYVTTLVKFRTTYDALSVNDTDFIHVDSNDGKQVVAWRRGLPGSNSQVVVVANFSDFGTPEPGDSHSQYRVNGWPITPPGRQWREITQDRPVPPEWVGREPIFPWEAKIYALF